MIIEKLAIILDRDKQTLEEPVSVYVMSESFHLCSSFCNETGNNLT